VREHNLEGSPGTQIIPELYREADYLIDSKKRLDCFYGTDLRQLLDALSVKSVVLMGINTNTCVLNTAFTAFNFDYRVVVLSDCVASMYGDDLHVLGCRTSRAARLGPDQRPVLSETEGEAFMRFTRRRSCRQPGPPQLEFHCR